MLRSVVIALSALVGSTGALAQLSVSGSGRLSYSSGIGVPPGIGGMQPNLSLNYAGGGVNGPLGVGWSIQGISTITRCDATSYIDGKPAPVKNQASDKLCLDSHRLIPVESTECPTTGSKDAEGLTGTSCREFRTEPDLYTRVRAYSAASSNKANGPLYFRAWTKSGLVYEYGESPNANAGTKNGTQALIKAQGSDAIMVWAVARVTDQSSNYMDFYYCRNERVAGKDQGCGVVSGNSAAGVEWNVSEIRYTGNKTAGTAPFNRVVFAYDDRTNYVGRPNDIEEAYHAGSKNINVKRLSSIKTYAGSVLVKTTQLVYDQGSVSGRSRLTKYRECFGAATDDADNPSGKCSDYTQFSYSNAGGTGIAMQTGFSLSNESLVDPAGNFGVLLADFNNDGRTDILRWWLENSSKNKLFLADPNNPGEFVASPLTLDHWLFAKNGCYQSFVGDFDGDGRTDIFRLASNNSGCAYTGGTSHIFMNRGDGLFSPVKVRTLAGNIALRRSQQVRTNIAEPSINGFSEGYTFYLVDVNRDGLLDIVVSYIPARNWVGLRADLPPACRFGSLSDGTGGYYSTTGQTSCTRVYLNKSPTLGDGVFVEVSTNLAMTLTYSDPGTGTDLKFWDHLKDLNGDGLLDLVETKVDGQTGITSWLNNGDGNFTATNLVADDCDYPLDFNGDGKMDCLKPDAANPANNKLLVSTGSGFTGSGFREVSVFNLTEALKSSGTPSLGSGFGVQIMDMNGDGRDDIYRWHDDSRQNKIFLSAGDGTFFDKTSDGYLITTLFQSNAARTTLLGDFRGRSAQDMLRVSSTASSAGDNYSVTNNLYYKTAPDALDRMVSMNSANGLTTTVEYTSATTGGNSDIAFSDRGDSSNAAKYPVVDISSPMLVVKSLTQATGTLDQATTTTQYRYGGFKVAVDGSGVNGFRVNLIQSPTPTGDVLTNRTEYHLMPPYAGLVKRSESRLTSKWIGVDFYKAAPLSSIENIYCDPSSSTAASSATVDNPCSVAAAVSGVSSTIHRPYLYKSVESGRDLRLNLLPTHTTTTTYNKWGDPLVITSVVSGTFDSVASTYTTKTENTYDTPVTAGDSWILGRLRKATVTKTVPNLGLTPAAGQ